MAIHRVLYAWRTHHIKGEDGVREVWIVFSVLNALGLDRDASTLKLHQRGGDLQQMETLHISHTPAQHLQGQGNGMGGGGMRRRGGGGEEWVEMFCVSGNISE